MKYHLTEKEYFKLWGSPTPDDAGRLALWNSEKYPLFKLSYTETNVPHLIDGDWGMVEGTEQQINWFLLSL